MSNLKIYRRNKLLSFKYSLSEDHNLISNESRVLIIIGIGRHHEISAKRLQRQAEQSGWFGKIYNVGQETNFFGERKVFEFLKDHMMNFSKGAGLWAWKPAVMALALTKLPKDVLVYYIDAGCEISVFGVERFAQYDKHLQNHSILCFELPFVEHQWSNSSLISEFPNLKFTSQIQATWFAVKNDVVGEKIITKWDQLSRQDNFRRLKEVRINQGGDFVGHRHDQSVLSCVIKSELSKNIFLPWEDMFQPWLYDKNSSILLAPVHCLRNSTTVSILDPLVKCSNLNDIESEFFNGPFWMKKYSRFVKRCLYWSSELFVEFALKIRTVIRLLF